MFDDNVFIQENFALTLEFFDAVKIFFSQYFFGDYLPVTLISYWLEINFFGYNPVVQHVFNLIIHLLNVFLLWNFIKTLFVSEVGHENFAMVICFFFALHPIQTEPVFWISERKTLLCIFFMLVGILSLRKNFLKTGISKNVSYYFFFALSLLCKTTNIFLPIWLMVIERTIDKLSWKFILRRHLLAICLSVVMIVIRLKAYANSFPEFPTASLDFDRLSQAPIQIVNALGIYLRMVFFPTNQTIIYPDFSFNYALIVNLTVFGIFALLVGLTWLKSRNSLILVFSSLVLLFLTPILQIVPRINYVSERYMYFPIIGIVALAYLAAKNLKLGSKFIFIVFILISIILTLNRSFVWVSNQALWADTIKKSPSSALAFLNYGLELQSQSKYEEAIASYEQSVSLGGGSQISSLAYNNLANIYSDQKLLNYFNLSLAINYYEKSIASTNNRYEKMVTMYNLAMLYASQKQNQKALELLRFIKENAGRYSDARFDSLVIRVNGVVNQLER